MLIDDNDSDTSSHVDIDVHVLSEHGADGSNSISFELETPLTKHCWRILM
jgi:hypothetical protein